MRRIASLLRPLSVPTTLKRPSWRVRTAFTWALKTIRRTSVLRSGVPWTSVTVPATFAGAEGTPFVCARAVPRDTSTGK